MARISTRRFLQTACLFIVAFILGCACAKATETAQTPSFNVDNIRKRSITAWERMGTKHIMGRTQTAFCDKLEELSQGKITTNRYLDGELETGGTPKDQFESRIVDSSRYTLELSNYYGFQEGTVFGLPFLFENREHFWRYADSKLGKKILDDLSNADQGLIALGYIEEGARHFFTTKNHPMTSHKNLNGLKIRVQTSDIYVGLVEAMGASATPMAWTEIYTALSTGVVDGAENPYSGYQAYLLNEVAPYIYEDGHIFAGGCLTFSKPLWNELNEDERALIRAAAEHACRLNRKMNETDEAGIKADLIAKGVIITVPTPEEKAEMFSMVNNLYEKFGSEHAELIRQIKAL